MSDIHVLSGAYAVDALGDDIERARFERHLADCPTCRAEVESLREAAASLSDDTAVVPPAELRASVLAGISKVRPLPPVTPDTAPVAAPGTAPGGSVHRRKWFPALVAAVVLALVGVGGVVWHPWRQDTATTVSAADRVLGAPDAQRISQPLPNGGSATIVRSVKLGQAVLVAKNIATPPDGKAYELWLLSPGKAMVPAGLVQAGQIKAGQTTVVLEGDAAKAVGAGVTVEPEGGSKTPSSDVVALFDFAQAA
jgi:anti-sigma-K factor RskA